MAGQTKKGNARTGGRSMSKNTKTKNVKETEAYSETIYREVILWVMLAVSVVLFISNLGIGGTVGGILSDILFGLFGLIAYFFPIFLFIGTVFIMSNGKNRVAVIKTIAAILFVCFLCLFLELIAGVTDDYSPVNSYLNSVKEHNGGGFFGGLFSWLICPNLGRISAFVIDFIVLIITMVVVTERSAWRHVEKGGRRVYQSAKEGHERRRVIQEQRREERELRRMEKKVSGVSIDTKLTADDAERGYSQALKEITPESFSADAGRGTGSLLPFARKKEKEQDVLPEPLSAGAVMEPEPAVVAQRQVSLRPLEASEPEEEKKEEMPVFSPELEKLFAQIGQEPSIITPQADPVCPSTDGGLPEILTPGIGQPRTEAAPLSAVAESSVSEPLPFTAEPTVQEPVHVEPIEPKPLYAQPGEQEPARVEPAAQELLRAEPPKPLCAEPEEPEEPAVPERPRSAPAKVHGGVPTFSARGSKKDTVSTQEAADAIAAEIELQADENRTYVYPSTDLLKKGDPRLQGDSKQHLQETALKLQQTLKNFGVSVTILNVSCGPTVTRYEIQPETGVKVSKIVNLTDDIKLNLAAADIRMEAPIPGKAAIGIEVPNKETLPVMLRDLLESEEFQNHASPIAFAAGRDIGGQVIMADIAKMPHLLIAGATGSGKSVCINTIIMSILYRADPEEVKLILIDPKVVELSIYNGIPHLFIPVVTDPKKAAGALNWAVAEMMERYQKFAECGVRDLKGYNAKIDAIADIEGGDKPKKLPQIVIIVDELADLMMVAPGDVEDAVCRLAQLARACGIHLIIATQRPSVNVITGLIKANMPSRIAFSVTSGVDSRTILDMVGAEKLLGKGDCLYYPQGLNKPMRVQGAFVSDQEVAGVVDFIKESYGQASYDTSIEEKMSKISESGAAGGGGASSSGSDAGGRDAYFVDAAKLLMDKDKASIGMLQRYFKIGFNRAARIMDQLEEAGVVGPEEGTKPRQILMNPETFESLLEDGSF